DLKINIKSANDDIKILILKTIGITLGDYKKYENRFKEENDEDYSNRLIDMLSILLNGLGNYKSRVKQAAIITIGKDIFASSTLSLKDKHNIFVLLAKKILTLTTEDRDDFLMFMTNSAAINHIYRFIADYTFFVGKINIDVPKQIAFFPGTFDPFSITHKNISKIIRDLGFEVYLAVDEFSWSKKTLPNLLRQNIINLSICDELNIYIYPEYFQTNISNENDLKILRENFKDSSLYFVSGGDVLLNASCYENKSTEDSIHSFNHIIFDRGNTEKLKERTNLIKGDVKIIMIPEKYSSVSSTQIRNYIDNSRDISDLTDPLVKQYIYEKGFYQREPMEKKSLLFEGLLFETIDGRDMIKIRELLDKFDLNGRIQNHLITSDNKEESKIIVIKNNNYSEIMAISCIHWVKNKSVFEDFKDEKVCKYIRENSSGRIISIDFIEINNNYNSETVSNTIATEVISYALSQDYEFAVYQCLNDSKNFEVITKTLKLLGFVEVDSLDKDRTTFAVDMSSPSMINLDVENVIKEPFRANKNVLKTIEKAREELQKLWISIFPGQLFITFDSNILHQKMINMICAENGVPIDKVLPPKERGPYMCVPFGDSLDRYVVPNTVTKSLHVDKYFSGDIKSFFIAEAPYYLTLKNQVRMIKSFDRDLILVDDFLHKGARLKKLDPILKEENITVKKLIVGILTGIGKDLMDTQGREIDSVYFLPKLKLWFNERVLYPFIGGDPVWRGKSPKRNLIESNNMILPYTFPTFMKDLDKKDVYQFSKVCLENSYEILKSLELEYHKIYGRNLTLETLGEVITNPRIPEFGEEIYYNLSLTPTSYVMKDLELLSRFKIMR
ncbi:MAG: cytidyltransferase, partial [Clostridioides sp.]|nr:cytidyltransferase [Clostridioides sp.]